MAGSQYVAFAETRPGIVYTGPIRHEIWGLQDASIEIERNTVVAAAGIGLPAADPVVHFSPGTRSRLWLMTRVRG